MAPLARGLAVLFLALFASAVAWGVYLYPPGAEDLLKAGGLWLVASLLDRARVSLPFHPPGGGLSLHFLGSLVGAFLLPPPYAGLVGALSLKPTGNLLREAFNRSQVGLATWSAASLASYPFLALLAYLGVNVLAVWLVASLHGISTQTYFRKVLRPYLPGYLLASPLAYAVVEVGRSGRVGVGEALLFLFPMAFLYMAWQERARLLQGVEATLRAVVNLLEERDAYTARHSERVAELAVALARRMGLEEGEVEALQKAALLHDIGKVGMPDRILKGEKGLSPEDWEEVRIHPVRGERILFPVAPFLGVDLKAVRHHHERWDGKGYPDGLKGEGIPLSARILAVADVYEALTSDRPYRKALSPAEALGIMAKEAGKGLDPRVVDLLVGCVREGILGAWVPAPTPGRKSP